MFFWGESKHPSLPLARAERKPFDRKKKLNPRHQRENHFWFSFGTQKRTLVLMKKRSNPAHRRVKLFIRKLNLAQPRSTPCATRRENHPPEIYISV